MGRAGTTGAAFSLVAAPRANAYLHSMATLAPDIMLTPAAAARVAAIAARQSKPAILRLSVEGGGCSGFQYKFGLADAPEAGDTIVETDGARLVVDDMSLDLVRGAQVDFVDNLGGAHFAVSNPNAASGCGCGTSFSV
jgi:iron-sulfur cluster assembly accessory protein